jgi:hypothetical protein
MKKTLIFPLVFAGFIGVACGGKDEARRGDQKAYETVQEGSAAGVTSSIQGPGEALPPLTGTNADTTTAFSIDPTVASAAPAPQQPGTLAGAMAPLQPAYQPSQPSYQPPPPMTSASSTPQRQPQQQQPRQAYVPRSEPQQPQPVQPAQQPTEPADSTETASGPQAGTNAPPPVTTAPTPQQPQEPKPQEAQQPQQQEAPAPAEEEEPAEEEPPPPTSTDTRGQ